MRNKLAKYLNRNEHYKIFFLKFIQLLQVKSNTLSVIFQELKGIVNLMGKNKAVSIGYAIVLLLTSYLWLAEFIPQQNMLFGFIWILVLCLFALAKTTLIFAGLLIFVYLMLKLVKRHKFIFSLVLLCLILLRLSVEHWINTAITNNTWVKNDAIVLLHPSIWMLHDLTLLIALVIIFFLIVFHHNLVKLNESMQPQGLDTTSRPKYSAANTAKVLRITLLTLIPILLTQTVVYRGLLLKGMHKFHMIVDDLPISLDEQQFKLLEIKPSSCSKLYNPKQTANYLNSQFEVTCIMPYNIMRVGFANEYVLIARNENQYKKIYCVNGRCVRNNINNIALVHVLMDKRTKFNELFDVIQSGQAD